MVSAGEAASCSPRCAVWSFIFCGRSTTLSACAAGVGEAAAPAFALAFAPPVFAFMSEEQPASPAAGSASAQVTSTSRESFIRSLRLVLAYGPRPAGRSINRDGQDAQDKAISNLKSQILLFLSCQSCPSLLIPLTRDPGPHGRSYSGLAAAAAAGRDPAPSCRRCSQDAQSMFEKKASMYFGRSAGL